MLLKAFRVVGETPHLADHTYLSKFPKCKYMSTNISEFTWIIQNEKFRSNNNSGTIATV